MKDSTD